MLGHLRAALFVREGAGTAGLDGGHGAGRSGAAAFPWHHAVPALPSGLGHHRPQAGTHRVALGAVQGDFKANQVIHAASTNGRAIIENFVAPPVRLAQILVRPDPFNIRPQDDYGYDIQLLEGNEQLEPEANN